MLVISRNPSETICIMDDIRITVLEVKNQQITLGIEAPETIMIHRKEVPRRIGIKKRGISKEGGDTIKQ
ncbi:carbon storage regulator [Pseudomonas fluorescens]|uniref:carbon storage regulator n=1 Tax=Pseudomonas fluorescens TaxID=294 RepID=UPI001BECE528|nr:carbon storage regulator [Pseudomonas fluorescens]MBT2375798.1 carbon storage regulator [Pseudomonas fluorescens]